VAALGTLLGFTSGTDGVMGGTQGCISKPTIFPALPHKGLLGGRVDRPSSTLPDWLGDASSIDGIRRWKPGQGGWEMAIHSLYLSLAVHQDGGRKREDNEPAGPKMFIRKDLACHTARRTRE
jgi:hypothetical protein